MMDISFIWSLRQCSLIAAVQMSPCRTESIKGHILGLLWEAKAFAHSLSPAVLPLHLRCDRALDAAVTPEAFTNKMQSILSVLFMRLAFLRVQLEVWIPILPSNALSSGVSAGWLSSHKLTCQNQHCLGLRRSEWHRQQWEGNALHQAGRVCNPYQR